MDIDVASYKALFLETARSCLGVIKQELASLSVNPSAQSVEQIFIKSHSLKGQSMTMGYSGIAKASLAIERYMREKKETQTQPDPTAIAVIQEAIEKIGQSLDAIERNDSELPLSNVITKLEQQLRVKV